MTTITNSVLPVAEVVPAHSVNVDWAALAADQAHLTREFTAAVGEPPGRYSRASQDS
jgi:hypothetical protein